MLQAKQQGEVFILKLSGKFFGGPETTKVYQKIEKLCRQDVTRVVMDLSKVTWINCVALGVLVSCMAVLRQRGGDLKLSNISDKIQLLFIITKLITIFDFYDTVDEAVKSFSK